MPMFGSTKRRRSPRLRPKPKRPSFPIQTHSGFELAALSRRQPPEGDAEADRMVSWSKRESTAKTRSSGGRIAGRAITVRAIGNARPRRIARQSRMAAGRRVIKARAAKVAATAMAAALARARAHRDPRAKKPKSANPVSTLERALGLGVVPPFRLAAGAFVVASPTAIEHERHQAAPD